MVNTILLREAPEFRAGESSSVVAYQGGKRASKLFNRIEATGGVHDVDFEPLAEHIRDN